MKRYFVVLTVALLSSISPFVQGQNLRLILEGPFVVCETSGTETLTIAVPNLQSSHFIPTISSDLGDVPLGDTSAETPQYFDPTHDVESRMTLKWDIAHPGPHKMVLNPPRNGQLPNSKFYSEKGNCDDLSVGLASVRLFVPVPDEVYALRPVDDPVFVVDDDNLNSYKGVCNSPCPYASKIVLRYVGIDPKSIDIETSCSGPGPCTAPPHEPDHDSWHPDPTAGISAELQLELSAVPTLVTDGQSVRKHEQLAFKAASTLSGVYRDLKPDRPPAGKRGMAATSVINHTACQIPPIVLCQTYTAGGACPKNY